MIPGGEIASWLQELAGRATAGFAVGLHQGPHAPRFLVQTFPVAWSRAYADEGLVLRDPGFAWAIAGTGWRDWRDFAAEDSGGLLARAARHGMRHGVIVAVLRGGSRSTGGFARPDRPFDPAEARALEAILGRLHDATAPGALLDPAQEEALRRLSVAFSRR